MSADATINRNTILKYTQHSLIEMKETYLKLMNFYKRFASLNIFQFIFSQFRCTKKYLKFFNSHIKLNQIDFYYVCYEFVMMKN